MATALNDIMPAGIPWWAWLLIAGACYFIQMMMSIRTHKGGIGAWTIRIAFIAVMVFSLLIGAIRFFKLAWRG